MLNDNEIDWLVEQLTATAELLGHEIKPNAAAMLAEDLSSYSKPVLKAALHRVRSEHTGRLTPKAILDRIDEAMGRPGANEAWAVAVNALDEHKTVVWTDEMAQAWEVARPIAKTGDLIGARMAFISAYERMVRTARELRLVPSVTVSLGHDKEGRALAVEKAVKLGYMPMDQATQYLPAPEPVAAFNVAGLLEGRVEAGCNAPPEIVERLAQLRVELLQSDARRAKEREAKRVAEANDWAERKARAQRMVNERVAHA